MKEEFFWGIPYKYISLVTLVVQNSTYVIMLHYSRVMVDREHQYFSSTAVFFSEFMKFLISLYLAVKTQKMEHDAKFSLSELYHDVFSRDAWKLMIPAALYTVQNNLQYVAASFLDAATFSVTYQLKILTTALFSVIMLKRSLSGLKWVSLVILTIGVALVQLREEKKKELTEDQDSASTERFVGLAAVLVACVISGVAGVYFEKVLKGTQASIWIRNVQLSLFSLFPALIIGVWLKDGNEIAEKGFFYGYSSVVWITISCQAIGGIVVAMVVKYADNILKGFATSLSIILSFLTSLVIFDDTSLSITFLAGSIFVLGATYLYSLPETSSAPIATNKETQGISNTIGDEENRVENDDEDLYDNSEDSKNGYTKVKQVELEE